MERTVEEFQGKIRSLDVNSSLMAKETGKGATVRATASIVSLQAAPSSDETDLADDVVNLYI